MFYVLFDCEKQGYMKDPYSTKRYHSPADGKLYKQRKSAINSAGILNVPRNIPPGHNSPTKHYQNRPNVEVHEVDLGWNVVAVYQAPPQYIIL